MATSAVGNPTLTAAVTNSESQLRPWSNCFWCKCISGYGSGWSATPKFKDHFVLGDTLGSGAFATVKLGTSITDGSNYAIKIVPKSKLSNQDEKSLRDEIGILQSLHHPHIIQLFNVYNEANYYYLVTELVEGGGLFQRIVSKRTYSESETRDICKILFGAIGYCHSEGIAHRDLKPENLLLMSKNSDSNLKIADFGFAKRVTSEKCLSTKCGTPYYCAPEILSGKLYGTKVDLWSMGVITYILFAGYPPFEDINLRRLFAKITAGKFSFHQEYWAHVSDNGKNFVSRLLTVNPDERLNATQALSHPWFQTKGEELAKNDLMESLSKLKTFNAQRKLRATARAVVMLSTFHGKKHSLSVDYGNSHYQKEKNPSR